MGPPDLGPEWAWKAGCIFAFVGIISLGYLISKGIIWLFQHVTIN